MAKLKSYLFLELWWQVIREQPDEIRLQLFDAINRFSFGEELPTLSPTAQGVFLMIRAQLENNKESYAAISEKRRAAGQAGNDNRWGENRKNRNCDTLSQKSQTSQMLANVANVAINKEKNKDNIKKKSSSMEEDKKESETPPPPPPKQSGFDVVFDWLTDDELTLISICNKLKLTHERADVPQMVELLRPIASEFYDGEICKGTNFECKGRGDTKRHFYNWASKQKITIENGNVKIHNGRDADGGVSADKANKRTANNSGGNASATCGAPTAAQYRCHC